MSTLLRRGALRTIVPIIVCIIALAFVYLALPVQLAGPTGLSVAEASGPRWASQTTRFLAVPDAPLTLDLDALFSSGTPLTYAATRADRISVSWSDDRTLVITPDPGFVGERTITLYASDGDTVIRQRIRISVTPETPPMPSETEAPLEKIERAVEDAFITKDTVDAIIILKETQPFAFSEKAGKQLKQQLLEARKQQIDQAQDALLEKMNEQPAGSVSKADWPALAHARAGITGAVVAENDLEIVHEYDTINALAVKLTRAGLSKLRDDPAVHQVLLDRPFRALLSQSVPLIDADDVHNMTVNGVFVRGGGEAICVIDTGIDLNHSAFANKIMGGTDIVNSDTLPQDDASNSHGTHVAGIAAGNSSAVKGVAPDARIVPVKVCGSTGSCSGSDILAGIDYCNNNSVAFNISVISGSLGDNSQYASANCPTLFDTALNTSVSLGIIPAFASGNNGFTSGISYPACSPFAISVGSVSTSDALSSFGNRGGDRLDVLAPGESIVSSVIGGSTGSLSGTSMSTPHVAGVIALIQQNQRLQNKAPLSLAELRQLLKETGKEVSSWHRIDAYAAIVKLNQNYTINITDNSVTNATPPIAKVKFKDATDLSRFVECSKVKQNFIEIDSVNCPQYNKSAHIILQGLAGTSATPLRNGEPCPASICQNVTFSSGTLEFDVTGFTNYSGNSSFGTASTVNGCAVINGSTSLAQNIFVNLSDSTQSCIGINANHTVLNCSGFSINGNGTGTGVNASRVVNVTIKNCIVNNFTNNIVWDGINGSVITNTTSHNGTVTALRVSVVNSANNNNLLIANSSFASAGDPVAGFLAVSISTANNLTFVHNNATGGSSVDYALLLFTVSNSNISDNNARATSGGGIRISGSNNTLINNLAVSADSNGMLVSTLTNSTIFNNTASSNTASGILISASANNSFVDIAANASSGTGILLNPFSDNNTFVNINATSDTGTSLVLNGSAGNVFTNVHIKRGSTGIRLNASRNNTFTSVSIGNTTQGISAIAGSNSTVIQHGFIANSSVGIDINESNATRIINNTIIGSSGIGISAAITTSTFSGAAPIPVGPELITTNISLNRINNTQIAIRLSGTHNDPIFNNTFLNNTLELFTRHTGGPFIINQFLMSYNITNGTLRIEDTLFGSIAYLRNVSGNGTNFSTDIRIGQGSVAVRSTVVPGFNVSANITLKNVAGPQPLVDFEDDGTFAFCTPPQCTALGFSNGIATFNVSGFTNYTVGGELAITDCPVNVSQTSTLTQNILTNTTASCIVINTSHITLNCSGFSIGGNTTGVGIDATNVLNVTIKNCFVENFSNTILLSGTNSSRVINNTARNSSSLNIRLAAANNNTLANNTVSNGTAGIHLTDSSNNTIIGNAAYSVDGISFTTSHNNTLLDNLGVGTSVGIAFSSSGSNILINNTGRSGSGSGILLKSTPSAGNKLINTTAVSNAFTSIFIQGGQNNTLQNTTIYTNASWIVSTAASGGNNLSNTTFEGQNGSILILPNVTMPFPFNISLSNLNVTFNNAFLNATNLSFLNLSAVITLRNITFADPKPQVDFEDDGTFADCPADVCTEISFSDGIFVFNTTHFTSFGSAATGGGGGGGGSSGGGGGGGGGGVAKPKKEETPPVEQPLPTLPVTTPKEKAPEEQDALIAPEAEAPAETVPEAQSTQARQSPAVSAKAMTRMLAVMFYSLAFLAVVALSIYWYALHHKARRK